VSALLFFRIVSWSVVVMVYDNLFELRREEMGIRSINSLFMVFHLNFSEGIKCLEEEGEPLLD
jgi:hypothetical protein